MVATPPVILETMASISLDHDNIRADRIPTYVYFSQTCGYPNICGIRVGGNLQAHFFAQEF